MTLHKKREGAPGSLFLKKREWVSAITSKKTEKKNFPAAFGKNSVTAAQILTNN